MTTRNLLPIHWCAMLILLSPPASHVSAGEPAEAWLEAFQRGDASTLPAYTLAVSLEEPANLFLGQGNAVWSCRITRGPAGLAALCEPEQLPEPVYHPPGTYDCRAMDYDDDGRLAVGMTARWVTLTTGKTNETYDEDRVFYVSPQGVVVTAGVYRTLDRCPPDDKGRCSWSYTALLRIWRALGHGFAFGLTEVEGDVSDSGNMNRARIRGSGWGGPPTGVWRMGVEQRPTRLVREATFLRNVDGHPLYKVTTHGARRFGDIILAEEGSFHSLLGGGEAIERCVVLKDFEARFDEKLFRQVKETLEQAQTDETVKVRDYTSGTPTPPPVTIHPQPPGSD